MGEPLTQQLTNSRSSRENEASDKALEANEIEEPRTKHTVTPVEKKRGGLKRHCAKFWWLHLIIFCVIFLVVALCL